MIGRLAFRHLTLRTIDGCSVASAPGPTNHGYNHENRNAWLCKCVEEIADIGVEICPLPGRNNRAPVRGKLQDFVWMTTLGRARTGIEDEFIVYVDVSIPVWLYTLRELEHHPGPICENENQDITIEHKYLSRQLMKINDREEHTELVTDYKLYADIDACDVWRKPDDDKSAGSFTAFTICSCKWMFYLYILPTLFKLLTYSYFQFIFF